MTMIVPEDDILNDKRQIEFLEWQDGRRSYSASDGYVIEAYPEPGEYCMRPWFRIIRDGVVTARTPAQHVSVIYL